jgi:hypothetical protein
MSFLRRPALPSLDIVRRLVGRAAPLALAALAACDSASAPAIRQAASLSFSARSVPISGSVASDPIWLGTRRTFDLLASDAEHTLVLTSVELVFDEIELERAGVAEGCIDDSGSGSGRDGGTIASGPTYVGSPDATNECAELETGPQLVSLPLGDTGAPTTPAIDVPIPAGTYSELELKLRPLNPNSGEDQAFIAAHPDLAGVSVRVRGTFDGEAFEYTTSLDDDIEIYFSPALEVGDAGVNITVNLDVLKWFRDGAGSLVDPRTAAAGQPNAPLVTFNIAQSLAVFEDDDHDGYDDRGGHGSDD